jgi:hypothetical protein
MSFKLQLNPPFDYRSPDRVAERFRQKQKILLQAMESLALCCVGKPCGEKATMRRKFQHAPIPPLMARIPPVRSLNPVTPYRD